MAYVAAFVLVFWKLSLNLDRQQGTGSSRSQHPDASKRPPLLWTQLVCLPNQSCEPTVSKLLSVLFRWAFHVEKNVYFAAIKYEVNSFSQCQ